jgi:hypothetical protein
MIKIYNGKKMALALIEAGIEPNPSNIRFEIEMLLSNEEYARSFDLLDRVIDDIDAYLWNWYEKAVAGECEDKPAGELKFIPKAEGDAMIERLQTNATSH